MNETLTTLEPSSSNENYAKTNKSVNGFVFSFLTSKYNRQSDTRMEIPRFSRLDKKFLLQILKYDCPNGKVKVKQFKKYYGEVFPLGNVSKYSQLVFKSIDKMGAGEITVKEFFDFLCLMSGGSMEELIVASFHLYDANKDSLISKSDLYKVFNFALQVDL